ncbi:hypothetical protein [Clostridium botulinum]|uniref:hypothetical protein n=1 Tax=Clostridium botulinum TaxID=1491 RepID=UPI003DA5BA25
MSKKCLLLCNRHNSIYGDNWCLWWGERESKSGYTSDIRLAHRFNEEEIKGYAEKGYDIPVPIDVIGVLEEYESKETYNKNLRVMIEKGTLNELMGLELKPLFPDDEIVCPNCGSCHYKEDFDYMGNEILICKECEYEFSEDDL